MPRWIPSASRWRTSIARSASSAGCERQWPWRQRHKQCVEMIDVSCPDAQDQAGYPPSSSTWGQAGDRAPKTANWPPGPPREAAPALAWLAHQNFAGGQNEARQNLAPAENSPQTGHRSPLAGLCLRRLSMTLKGFNPAERSSLGLLRPCPYPCCSADRACCGCCGP